MADMDMMAMMGIAGFGKASKTRTLDPNRFDKNKREDVPTPAPQATPALAADPSAPESSEEDEDEIGPPPPPVAGPSSSGEPEYDPREEFPDDDTPLFPITHSLALASHTKPVSALTLDPSGARVLSGAHDYDVKLWDFGGMSWEGSGVRPFKSWEPAGSYHIHDLKYSNDGQRFLVVSGTLQAKLYDRDGEEQATFIKGDPYIRDMKHTSGHVGELFSCSWHPKDAQTFITSSADSTIRIWDVENKRKQKSVIVIKSKERGARTKVTACSWSTDGSMISGACLDGALHMYSTNSNFVRPNLTVLDAHAKNTETGSVVFSVDGRTLLTRGGPGDDTVKLWDLRSFRKPLAVRKNLNTLYPLTNAVFSPDEKYIITGAGADSKGGKGKVLFLKREPLSEEKGKEPVEISLVNTLEVQTTPIKVCWHSKINQIVTGLSNGQIHVLYSPSTSANGAKLVMNKGPARKVTVEDMSGALAAPPIITPGELPMYRDGTQNINIDNLNENLSGGWGVLTGGSSKRKREKDRMDPRKSRRPELPVTGPGKGGRVGASATQHVVQHLVRDTTRDEDPREALLKYAKETSENPRWTAAWQANQPEPVFAAVSDDEEDGKDSK